MSGVPLALTQRAVARAGQPAGTHIVSIATSFIVSGGRQSRSSAIASPSAAELDEMRNQPELSGSGKPLTTVIVSYSLD